MSVEVKKKPWFAQLQWQILMAMGLALPVGVLGGPDAAEAVGWLGDLFLRLLKMVVVPLIFFSIVAGVTGVGSLKRVGRLGGKTLVYYILTSTLAILTGLLLANAVHPGDEGLFERLRTADVQNQGTQTQKTEQAEPADLMLEKDLKVSDLLFRMVPENPIEDMVYSEDDPKRGPNVLGVIFFALLFGACILALKQESKERLSSVFETLFGVMMIMTDWIIRTAPIGVFALLVRVVGTTGLGAFATLGVYMLTVLGALALHAFVTLPLICLFVARRNPWPYVRALGPALATAFSTASSNAALPVTLDSVERAGISNRVTSFVLPLGATINMDGTALYECVAVLFLAQCYGVDLSLGQQMVVVMTALLASVGAAGIPHAGLVMMSIVLTAVGLPLEGMGVILAVDRILDMCRTTTNVWSDAIGAAVVARLEESGGGGTA
ncbi:MAG: dicarboxylate/amino acid:cation symporter [Deltaproteobacteria bacterium]|nr:dicarboxylate/amino acid:cation symporter [Deltaproteobacteria bacterium]